MNNFNPGMVDVGVINPASGAVNAINPGGAGMINPNQVKPSPINPKLFSNMDMIGSLNPGSTYNQTQPIMPPNGVQTPITPDQGINNF